MKHRYAVVETWGEVPEQIARIVGSEKDVLLYDEYRDEVSQQELFRSGVGIVGGWAMEYRGVHEQPADDEPLTPAEQAEFDRESERTINATRPQPGDADIRLA